MNLALVALIIFLGGSVKYILFGIKRFDNIFFHFTQFIVMNFFMLSHLDSVFRFISGIFLWTLFGLSPHDNTDSMFEYIFEEISGDHSEDHLSPSNHSDRLLSSNSSSIVIPEEILKITEWIDSSRFLLTVIILFGVFFFSFSSNFIMTSFDFSACWNSFVNCLSCKKNVIRNRSYSSDIADPNQTVFNRAKTSGYTNFLVKLVLIGYCNLSSITIAQMLIFDELHFAEFIFALITFVLVIIGFPIFITWLLYHYSHLLYETNFRKRWGSIYNFFQDDPILNKFMVLILVKQLIYSIIINISQSLNVLQNTLMLSVNLIFLIIIWKYRPYKSNLYQLQAQLMGICVILVSVMNYFFLIGEFSEQTKFVLGIVSILLHVSNFIIFVVLTIIRMCIKEKTGETPEEIQQKREEFQSKTLRLNTSEGNLVELTTTRTRENSI